VVGSTSWGSGAVVANSRCLAISESASEGHTRHLYSALGPGSGSHAGDDHRTA
jgi:hypothetical protein